MFRLITAFLTAVLVVAAQAPMQNPQDPNLWLEDVLGERALDWVRARNAECEKQLAANDLFRAIEARTLAILDSDARIAYVTERGPWLYNLWQDARNPRGLWRRTSHAEYAKDQPAWDVILDLDALGRAENENWVWKGSTFLLPDRRRCLLSLSRGGADAVVVREFDVEARRFVDDGFVLPEAKSMVSWRDADSIYVCTDFGPGSKTDSGYPRIGKLWRRGTPLSSATTVAEGAAKDVFLNVSRDQSPGFVRDFVYRGVTFYTNELFVLQDGKAVKIEKPDSANASTHHDWLLIDLREPWEVAGTTYAAGSLLACRLDAFLRGERAFDVLFAPTDRSSLAGWSGTKNHILVTVLDNVRNKVFAFTHDGKSWTSEPLPGLPEFGTISASAVDGDAGDDYWLTITDYLTPTSLWRGTIGKGPATMQKSLPALFDADGLMVEQHEAVSKDGTRVPYFQVGRRDRKPDGKAPTLLYGYGGFEVSMTPGYSATVGASWLARGGTYVVANIRGGGEFGPRWHQAALKQNRHRCYEDFAAVAEDLIRRKVTSAPHLGIQGGSNGGLLMGNMLTTYPQLFGAIVCQVPLLDMLRYHTLLAGASWMGEYGDPDDPEEAKWLVRYSPYHQVAKDAKYPPVLFTTSTRDDRVHPGHARKMTARMLEQGHDVLYYENIEGGHGGAADNRQAAFLSALAFTFLWQKIGTGD